MIKYEKDFFYVFVLVHNLCGIWAVGNNTQRLTKYYR